MQERETRPDSKVSHLPLVPLRDIVVFPHTMLPFVVGRRMGLEVTHDGSNAQLSSIMQWGASGTSDAFDASWVSSVKIRGTVLVSSVK